MKNKSKMKVPIGVPINQTEREDRFYISIDDILLVQKEKEDKNDIEKIEDDFEIWLYIRKTALLSRLSSDPGDLPIKKIGPGMKSEDFFIDFSDCSVRTNVMSEETIEESFYLAPVKVNYYYPDVEDFEEDSVSVKSKETSSDQSKNGDVPLKLGIIEENIRNMSYEELIEMEKSIKEMVDLINELSLPIPKKFYRWVVDLICKAIDDQTSSLKTISTKTLEQMTPEELDIKFEEAQANQDYETCGKIRDLRAQKENKGTG